MGARLDDRLKNDLKKFGVTEALKCYQCGNCTSTCPLSTNDATFPRKMLRYVQLGMKDKILASPEPWLCYYCGECSVSCPRGADPGETMMGLRRYLTSQYDWTGFSKRFYTSHAFEILSIIGLALIVGILIVLFRGQNINWEVAQLSSFVNVYVIEFFAVTFGIVLATLLISNTIRMARLQLGSLWGKIPASMYMAEFKELIVNFFTQKSFSKCDDKMQWYIHLLLVSGYVTIFILAAVLLSGLGGLLPAFQTDEIRPLYHPYNILGIYSTVALLTAVTYHIVGRIRKKKPVYRNSHSSDWAFLILLGLTTITGILILIFRTAGGTGMPAATYAMYTLHLMLVASMLGLEVPFAKWAHLAYRPVTIFLLGVKKRYYNSSLAQTPSEVVSLSPAIQNIPVTQASSEKGSTLNNAL